MVKTVQITMYENELTGKQYKTFEKAKKEELASRNLILLDKLGEEFGFKTTSIFGRATSSGNKLMKWIDENNSKFLPKSGKNYNREQTVHYATNNLLSRWKFYETGFLEKEVRSAWKILNQKLIALSTIPVKYFVDNLLVLETEDSNVEVPYSNLDSKFDKNNKFLYKEDLTKEGLKLYFWDISKPIDSEIKYEALNKFNIKNWAPFNNVLERVKKDYCNGLDLTREQEFEALEYGGVDNWSGYEYALDLANEDGVDWGYLESEDKLDYLESAGVDNWSCWSESLQDYREANCEIPEITNKDFVEIFEEISQKDEWNNYKDYIKFVYEKQFIFLYYNNQLRKL